MKIRVAALLVGVCAMLFTSKAAHAGDQDFTLVNKTGFTITKVLVAPHDDEEWGDDIMGKDTLGDDESVEIKFSRKETAEMWDLKVFDKDGHTITWSNLNLLKISKITLHFDGSKATADLE
jgi:hypothetical protein